MANKEQSEDIKVLTQKVFELLCEFYIKHEITIYDYSPIMCITSSMVISMLTAKRPNDTEYLNIVKDLMPMLIEVCNMNMKSFYTTIQERDQINKIRESN
jgi:hypothetical protein